MNDLIITWNKTAEFNSHEHFIRYPLYICEGTYDIYILKATISLDIYAEEYCISIYIDDMIQHHNYCFNTYFIPKTNYDLTSILVKAHYMICNLLNDCIESNIEA